MPVWWAGTVSTVGATTVHPTKMQLPIQKGQASNNRVTHLVVTLYEHGLLGEGAFEVSTRPIRCRGDDRSTDTRITPSAAF